MSNVGFVRIIDLDVILNGLHMLQKSKYILFEHVEIVESICHEVLIMPRWVLVYGRPLDQHFIMPPSSLGSSVLHTWRYASAGYGTPLVLGLAGLCGRRET
jgi:hypothetical protein